MTGFIHISPSEKRTEIPELGEGKACDKSECPGPKGWEMSYGLAGGGMGAYNFCNVCDRITEKTCDPDDEGDEA